LFFLVYQAGTVYDFHSACISNFYGAGVLFFQELNGIVFWQVNFAFRACFSVVTEHILQCLSTMDLCISIPPVKIGKNFGIMVSNTG